MKIKIKSHSTITGEDGIIHISMRISKYEWIRISVDEAGVVDFLHDKELPEACYETISVDFGCSASELNEHLLKLLKRSLTKLTGA